MIGYFSWHQPENDSLTGPVTRQKGKPCGTCFSQPLAIPSPSKQCQSVAGNIAHKRRLLFTSCRRRRISATCVSQLICYC